MSYDVVRFQTMSDDFVCRRTFFDFVRLRTVSKDLVRYFVRLRMLVRTISIDSSPCRKISYRFSRFRAVSCDVVRVRAILYDFKCSLCSACSCTALLLVVLLALLLLFSAAAAGARWCSLLLTAARYNCSLLVAAVRGWTLLTLLTAACGRTVGPKAMRGLLQTRLTRLLPQLFRLALCFLTCYFVLCDARLWVINTLRLERPPPSLPKSWSTFPLSQI